MSSTRLRSMSSPSANDAKQPSVPEEEAKEIASIMKQKLIVDDMWYCISMHWWDKWKEYTSYEEIMISGDDMDDLTYRSMKTLSLADPIGLPVKEEEGSKESSPFTRSASYSGPGLIKNDGLIGDSPNELVKNITLDTHYVLVPEAAWKKLHSWYGGGPEFARKVVAMGDSRQLKIELYPNKFQVVRAGSDGSPVVDSMKGCEGDENYQCLYFNSDSTMANILEKTCEAFSTFRMNSRLWVSQTLDKDNWRLVGKSESVSDLCDSGETACLMLEVKGKETGTFPRDVAVVKSTWREDLKVGDLLDAQDHAEQNWYESQVTERTGDVIKLHFFGWEPKFDEKFNIVEEPARLQPLNTKVKFWRDFRVNDDIEMRHWRDMEFKRGGFDWELVRIDSIDREKKEMDVYFKKQGRGSSKYTVSFDSEEIMWRGCHTKSIGDWRNRISKGSSGGDTAGIPKGGPGVVGLTNLGNTCFMNSMLQCLSNCEPLTDHFLSGVFESNINLDNPLGMGGRLAECYANLLTRMWSNETVVCRPSGVKKLIGEKAPNFQGYQQQDSSEFMNYLLDGLHEDLNAVKKKPYVEEKEADGRSDKIVADERWEGFLKRNDSFIVSQFFGLMRSEVRCDDKECNRVSVTFDPQRAFMLPLPAIKTVLIKVTMIFCDPMKPIVRYGATVSKQGAAKDLRKWLSDKTGVQEELLFLTKINFHKIFSMIELDEPVKRFSDYYDYYCYEIESEETIQANIMEENEESKTKEGKKMEEPPEKDENGVYIGVKCRCRWKSMNGAYYNGEVRSRNEDGTYVIDYADGDEDLSVDVERLFDYPKDKTVTEGWGEDPKGNNSTTYHWRKPDALAQGFHTEGETNRITVECLHRVPRASTYYNNTPQKDLTQFPLILSMKKNINGAELHTLVWNQLKRFITPDSEWNRHNLPYVLRVDNQYSCNHTKNEPVEDLSNVFVNFEERQSIVVDWNAEGVKTGFDTVAFEKREDHESYPSRTSINKDNENNLSLLKCFHEMAKEEQLGENDKWHCSECRKAGREPFRQAFKKMTVYRTGEILILHLKRFTFEAGFSASFVHREKIDSVVSYPVEGLDLTGIVAKDHGDPEPIYDLFAVSNHSGGLGGGHYTAYGKNPKTKKWYMFNDSSTHEVDASEVVTKQAYVLFYQRRKGKSGGNGDKK